jgi:phosphotransferase system HPr (HPr) family protein
MIKPNAGSQIMKENSVKRTVTIKNSSGLHARPAMLLAEMANRYEADVTLSLGRRKVDAKSIMELLTLGAGWGTKLTIAAQGKDASKALNAIANLIVQEFSEAENGN